jgi:hypothetical protein
MKVQSNFSRFNLFWIGSLAAVLALCTANSFADPHPHYLITNNDSSQGNSATFYRIVADRFLKEKVVVKTGGVGVDGIGAVATKRVSILDDRDEQCAFVSDAASADVAGISIRTLKSVGTFKADPTDSAPFGIPVGHNERFLYAGFTGSGTLATYRILRGCKLQFIQDVPAFGLLGGSMLDFSVHKNILVMSFQDGSIGSFNLSGGVPVANGDLQFSTGHTQNGSFPAGVDISADGHFALFGGTNVPPIVEVSDISSGKLEPTVVYSNLGNGGGSEAIWLSPDESLLYLSNFSSNSVTATFFNKNSGEVSFGCISPTLRGSAFEAGLATAAQFGTGITLFVAEPEINVGIVRVRAEDGNCSLTETPQSPVSDQNTVTLESIGVFPPRRF